MGEKNPKVDAFVRRAKTWQGEIQTLRSILLGCGLDEDLKYREAYPPDRFRQGHQRSLAALRRGRSTAAAQNTRIHIARAGPAMAAAGVPGIGFGPKTLAK